MEQLHQSRARAQRVRAAILGDDLGITYVAKYSSRTMPLIYKISAFWALLFAIPFLFWNFTEAAQEILHIYFLDYFPFIILLWGLFTISGGIYVGGAMRGSPRGEMLRMAYTICNSLGNRYAVSPREPLEEEILELFHALVAEGDALLHHAHHQVLATTPEAQERRAEVKEPQEARRVGFPVAGHDPVRGTLQHRQAARQARQQVRLDRRPRAVRRSRACR